MISIHSLSLLVSISAVTLALGATSLGCIAGSDGGDEPAGEAADSLITGTSHVWAFDEASGTTALDSVGSVNGTLGPTVSRVAGVVGSGAVSLPGGNDSSYVSFPGLGQIGTGNFTASMWIKTTDGFNTNETNGVPHRMSELFSNRDNGSAGSFFDVRFRPSGISLEVCQDTNLTNYAAVTVSGSFNDGAWHRVVARRRGATATMFVDGVSGSATGAGVANIVSSAQLAVGNNPVASTYGLHYIGQVDDLRVDNRALCDCEVTGPACAVVPLYDDSCDKPTLGFQNFSQTIAATPGRITKVWAGIGSWSSSWVYTVTLSTASQTVTYSNLSFSPRSQQGYSPCNPRNNMAGAALPAPFDVPAGQAVTISISGSGGDLHRDAYGKVRMTLDGTAYCD